ncbi:MAG: hypothetical protein ABEJ91_01045 [Candidatus Nanohaloarchaea archaeon]
MADSSAEQLVEQMITRMEQYDKEFLDGLDELNQLPEKKRFLRVRKNVEQLENIVIEFEQNLEKLDREMPEDSPLHQATKLLAQEAGRLDELLEQAQGEINSGPGNVDYESLVGILEQAASEDEKRLEQVRRALP